LTNNTTIRFNIDHITLTKRQRNHASASPNFSTGSSLFSTFSSTGSEGRIVLRNIARTVPTQYLDGRNGQVRINKRNDLKEFDMK
jgi:hypothetical protein